LELHRGREAREDEEAHASHRVRYASRCC
jgi:hypothetical protein